MEIKKINISDIGGFRIGNAQDYDAMTGVTAIVFDVPNTCGIDISGGGPAARESYLFTPLAAKQSVSSFAFGWFCLWSCGIHRCNEIS